jgi:hypothetical protein
VDRVLEGRLGVQSLAEARNIIFSGTPRATLWPTKRNYFLGNKVAGAWSRPHVLLVPRLRMSGACGIVGSTSSTSLGLCGLRKDGVTFFMCVCMCVCMYVCMYVYIYIYICNVWMYCVCMCVCMYICVYICMYVGMHRWFTGRLWSLCLFSYSANDKSISR